MRTRSLFLLVLTLSYTHGSPRMPGHGDGLNPKSVPCVCGGRLRLQRDGTYFCRRCKRRSA